MQRREQIARAVDRRARIEVPTAIAGGNLFQQTIVSGHAGLRHEAPEPLDPGFVDADLPRDHADVEILEMPCVVELECGEITAGETAVRAVDAAQRGARRRRVIEQRVIEIEQDHPWNGERRHPHIIRTGCMVD